jgi:hypothetical protein
MNHGRPVRKSDLISINKEFSKCKQSYTTTKIELLLQIIAGHYYQSFAIKYVCMDRDPDHRSTPKLKKQNMRNNTNTRKDGRSNK